jgi:arginase family enzyme
LTPEKVYCSFDFDVFDSSLFSATGYPEEGGLDLEGVLAFLEEIKKEFFWIDLVEYNPFFDPEGKGFKVVKKVLKTLYEDYFYED